MNMIQRSAIGSHRIKWQSGAMCLITLRYVRLRRTTQGDRWSATRPLPHVPLRWGPARLFLFVVLGSCCMIQPAASGNSPEIEAVYLTQSAGEGQDPLTTGLRLTITSEEMVEGNLYVWWEMSVTTRTAWDYGVRILSERPAMTSPDGIGAVARYLYRAPDGKVFEYRDQRTGAALLPEFKFRRDFLPVPAPEAAYDGGFASAGRFQGHTLIRVLHASHPARVSFDEAKILELRSDVLMGPQMMGRNDYVPLKPGDDIPKARPYTLEELQDLINAGINLFADVGEHQQWLKEQAVFFRSAPSFPDSFYRSNYYPRRLYMDEPAVRFGWDPEIPERNLLGPEQMAEALRRRVETYNTHEERKINIGWGHGSLEPYSEYANSWDTYYYTAWYQLAAGAPALFHEGRYRDRGYGWSPEAFFGDEGLEDLAFRDMMDYFNGFLRGAARAWNADWGVSVYPEGLSELFPDVFRQSYDMGARYFLFWTHPPVVNHNTHLQLGRVMREHIKAHPRGDIREANRQAEVAIVLPAGYTITPNGSIWGFEPDQVSRGGATYGEIAGAAAWEAILCSRRGIPYDFQVDAPHIRELGYQRLVYVGEDASLLPVPPWENARPAQGLELSIEQDPSEDVIARATMEAEYRIARAESIVIDGNLDDWKPEWITLGEEEAGSDLIELEISVPNVASATLFEQHHVNYLGIEFEQLDAKLQEKFDMEDYHIIGPDAVDENRPGIRLEQGAVIITGVREGSPADEAGLRPGDVIRRINKRETEWHFVVWGIMHNAGQKGTPEQFTFALTRNEKSRIGYEGDLEAQVALAVDDEFLYLAAKVTDDVQSQPFDGWYFWQGDCLQLGLSPTLSNTVGGYSAEDHEIGFTLKDNGEAVTWRYQGRRGRTRQEIPTVDRTIVRDGNQTRYEAAIPLDELQPLAPDLWPKVGVNIVINDHDGADERQRKGRLELREGAMTRSKNTREFAVCECEPSPDKEKVSSALLWRRRATLTGGFFRLLLAARSPEAEACVVRAVLQSLDSPQTDPVFSRLEVPLTAEPKEWSLRLGTESPLGRYSLTVRVEDEDGRLAVEDRLPVYVYPESSD